MSVKRLKEVSDKIDSLTEELRKDTVLRDFATTHRGTEAVRSLCQAFEQLDNADELLRDVIRYHPDGDCPR